MRSRVHFHQKELQFLTLPLEAGGSTELLLYGLYSLVVLSAAAHGFSSGFYDTEEEK